MNTLTAPIHRGAVVHKKYRVYLSRVINEQGDTTGRPLWRAKSTTFDLQENLNSKRGETDIYQTLDKLAEELATFPGIEDAEFIPHDGTQKKQHIKVHYYKVLEDRINELKEFIKEYTKDKN